jgi:magnesium-protoporphyrin IX monomethyl ester (oxidative) cyclase
MKVLLIHTKFNYKSYDPPLGLLYIVAVLKQNNINVKILDTSFKGSLNEVFYEIEKYSPDVIGIYSMTIDMDYAIKISKFAKEKNVISVIGGPHATMLPYETIKYFDFVVRGEGEFTFLELIKALESKKDLREINGIIFKRNDKVIENKLREPIKNLDSLPFPARELIEIEKYINLFYWLDEIDINLRGTSLITSRGCPYNCAFCQPTLRKLFGERIRFRSVDNVIKEIEILISDYKINALHFYDDTFTFNKKWIREFCNKIKRYDVLWDCSTRVDQVNKEILREMYRAGCRKIEFGVESGSQRILNNILRKGITFKQAEKAIKEAKEVEILTYVFS